MRMWAENVVGILSEHPQINEDDEKVKGRVVDEDALLEIRRLLGQEKGLALSDSFLRKCLVYQNGCVQRASGTAERFIAFRRAERWPFRLMVWDVDVALRTGLHWLLPGVAASDALPAVCLVFNMAALDPSRCSIQQYQKLTLFLMECATDALAVQQRGVALLADFRELNVGRFRRALGVEDIKRGLRCWVGSFPCRVRRIWLLGAPTVVRWLIAAVSNFLSAKVRQRIRMTENVKDVAEDLGLCINLPTSLGGESHFDWDAEVQKYLTASKVSL